MPLFPRFPALCIALFGFGTFALAQNAPERPKPDSSFGNWLYKSPDPHVWQRAEKEGNLVFSVDEPPGDFCILTLFAGATAEADFAGQFNRAIAADQKAKDTVKIEADTGAKPSKSIQGYDVLTRNLRSETSALHTFHIYSAGRSGGRFDLVAFQTTSEQSWNQYGAQAAQFFASLRLANSLPPGEVAKLVKPTPPDIAPAPTLPGFEETPTPDVTATPATTAVAVIPEAAPAAAPPAAPATDIPDFPLSKSSIVVNNAVIQKNGKPVDGIKLSQHDKEIGSPSIAVGPDGVIHVAFVEKHRTTNAYAVYHRMSRDGGKTWSEAKNLTEDMPGFGVGRCYVLADTRNRAYVIWRAGIKEGFAADLDPASGRRPTNLWFRVWEGGAWTRAKMISEPADVERQTDAALGYFAAVDAAGHPQVIWNVPPDKWHPEIMVQYAGVKGPYRAHSNGVGNGLVFQATLDGASVSQPREIFLPAITKAPGYGICCDGLDTPVGYFDTTGSAHFIAEVSSVANPVRGKSRYELIENGKAGPILDLPELSFHAWRDIPTLLIDAQGRRHVIALFLGGERPNVRDYLIGTDEEPTVIRATAEVAGKVEGFQAYQGPGGRMAVIMQMDDTGARASGETYVSISRGQGWSTPVNVTNNAGRAAFASTQTSSRSNVTTEKSYFPGPAAAAFDREGHLVLAMVNNEFGSFGSSAFGVELAGSDSSIPTLQFLRF